MPAKILFFNADEGRAHPFARQHCRARTVQSPWEVNFVEACMKEIVRRADIVVAAIGKAFYVKGSLKAIGQPQENLYF